MTTWPVITEASHVLCFSVETQIDFLKWLKRGAVRIYQPLADNFRQIIEVTKKYSNAPMDLADASLIVVLVEPGIKDIMAIDADCYIYQTMKKEMPYSILAIRQRNETTSHTKKR